MLSLRLDREAPENACVIGHYTVSPINPREHISLIDRSFYEAENRSGRELTPISITVGNSISGGNPIVFTESVLDRNVRTPQPLPYVWRVGSNTKLNRAQYYVYDENAAALAPINVNAIAGTQDFANKREAEDAIKKNFEIIDQRGEAIRDIPYEVRIVGQSTDSNGFVRFEVDLYTDRLSDKTTQLRLRYNATDGNLNRVLNNTVEAINSTLTNPITYRDSTDTTPSVYTLGVETVRGENYSNLTEYNRTAEARVNLLGLFAERDGVQVTITGSNLDVTCPSRTTNSVSFTLSNNKTLEALCSEINSSSVPLHVTPLVYGATSDVLPATSQILVPTHGMRIRSTDRLGIYYEGRAKIRPFKPTSGPSTRDPWYLTLSNGVFRKRTANADVLYRIPEYSDQIPSAQYGSGNRDIYREETYRSAPNIIGTSRQNIDISSVILEVDGEIQNSIIRDYDENAGVIYVSSVNPETSVLATYTFEEKGYEVSELNLNPTLNNNPDAARYVYAIYIVPERIERFSSFSGTPGNYTPSYQTAEITTDTVRVARGNSMAQAIATMQAEAVTTGGSSLYPVLLALVNVTNQLDIKDVQKLDCRTLGGGIPMPHPEQEESEFYTGLGYVGGEPYSSIGPVVIETPRYIYGDLEESVDPNPALEDTYTSYGGETEESVKAIANRYLPAGTLPLIGDIDE